MPIELSPLSSKPPGPHAGERRGTVALLSDPQQLQHTLDEPKEASDAGCGSVTVGQDGMRNCTLRSSPHHEVVETGSLAPLFDGDYFEVFQEFARKAWLDPSTLVGLLGTSIRSRRFIERMAEPNSPIQATMSAPLRALCRITGLPLRDALDLLRGNPAGISDVPRLTDKQQIAWLRLAGLVKTSCDAQCLIAAGLLAPSVQVIRIQHGESERTKFTADLLIHNSALLGTRTVDDWMGMLANGPLRDAIIHDLRRVLVKGNASDSGVPTRLVLLAHGSKCREPSEQAIAKGLRVVEMGEGQESVQFRLHDCAPLLDRLKSDRALNSWLNHGYFDVFQMGDQTDHESNYFLAELVNFSHSRIEGFPDLFCSGLNLNYSVLKGREYDVYPGSQPRITGLRADGSSFHFHVPLGMQRLTAEEGRMKLSELGLQTEGEVFEEISLSDSPDDLCLRHVSGARANMSVGDSFRRASDSDRADP